MADNEYLMNEEEIPANWEPVDATPSAPAVSNRILKPKFFSGSLPPNLQHDSSFVGTEPPSYIPKNSLMPFGNQSNPFTNAAATSTAKIVTTQIVNALPKPVPPAASITDGLIHGDAIWETDSAYIFLRDEFVSGPVVSPGSGSIISSLSWVFGGSSGFQEADWFAGLGPLHIGEFSWTNSATSNSPTRTAGIGNIYLGPGVSSQPNTSMSAWPLLGFPSWKATFIWRFHRSTDGGAFSTGPNFAKKSVYIGLGNNVLYPGGGWSRPPIFIGARYDTDATAPAISDSTIKLEAVQNTLPNGGSITRNNTQGTVVDTGIVPSEDVYYRLDITCTTAGQVVMSLNGANTTTFTLPKITVSAGTVGSDSVSSFNGQASLVFGSSGGSISHPFGPGTSIIVSGFTGGNGALNGTFICNQGQTGVGSDDRLDFAVAGTIGNNGPGGWSVQGYASLIPIFMFGNDSTASPSTDTRICIDYFSFVWNPGVGGGTGTPNATKSRYF